MRRALPILLSAAVSVVPVACTSVTEEPFILPEGQHIGMPIQPQKVLPFAVVDATPQSYFDQTLLVEATVAAVCQNMGCWMQIEDEGRTAMVRWESGCGGEYAFPTDSPGRQVLIQGSFYPTEISEDDIAHLQAEAGEDLELEREGYEFNASAVLIQGE